MSWNVDVEPARRDGGGVRFTVRVNGHTYDVGLSEHDAARLAPGVDGAELVRESFRFLLDREPPESILPRFDLQVIERYFPEYESTIRRQFAV